MGRQGQGNDGIPACLDEKDEERKYDHSGLRQIVGKERGKDAAVQDCGLGIAQLRQQSEQERFFQ